MRVTCVTTRDVLLVEPNQLFRDGLRHIMREPCFNVIAAVQTATDAFDKLKSEPGLIIWGPGTGVRVVSEIGYARNCQSSSQKLHLVVLADVSNVALLRRLADLDVDAVLSQDISSDVLHKSLDLVMLGQQLFPAALLRLPGSCAPAFQGELISFPARSGNRRTQGAVERGNDFALSPRERQILRHLVNGASNKVIAYAMSLTEDAIKAHVKALLRRVGASNRTQAAIWAVGNLPMMAEESAAAVSNSDFSAVFENTGQI